MTQFFQSYFLMALEASVVILLVFLLRPLFKKFSNRIASLLWIAVLFRLLCPYGVKVPAPEFLRPWVEAKETMTVGAVSDLGNDGIRELAKEQGDGTGVESSQLAEYAMLQAEADGQGEIRERDDEDKLGADAWQGAGDVLETDDQQGAGDALKSDDQQGTGDAYGEGTVEGPGDAYGADSAQGVGDALKSDDQQGAGDAHGERTVEGQGEDYGVDTVQGMGNVYGADLVQGAGDAYGAGNAQDTGDAKYAANAQDAEKAKYAANARDEAEGVANVPTIINVCGVIWAVGAILFFLYGAWNYVSLQKRLRESIPMGKWKKYPVRISDVSGVPMSFGVLRPGIYVPASFGRDGNREQEMILCHEGVHLGRRDPLWKLLSLLALCLHWWNPLVWACIYFIDKDMEMACDEGVLSQLGQEKKAEYAKALLHFAAHKSGITMAAAFGESNAESRIKEALKYKKRPAWTYVLMACLVITLAGCLTTKPSATKEDEAKTSEIGQEAETSSAESSQKVREPAEEGKEPAVILEITNLEQAMEADLPFQTIKEHRVAPVNVPYFGYDENVYLVFYVDELRDEWKANAPEKYQALKDPATALETLLPLKGGNAEAMLETYTNAEVQYTFANGEKAHYFMTKRGEIWYPYLFVEQLIANHTVDNGEGITQRWDQLAEQKALLAKTTAAQLRSVTLKASDVEYGRNFDTVKCWDPNELGDYCILQEIPEEDAYLYGLYDGHAMMLRVGDQAYPVHDYWTNLRSFIPKIYCGDYDHDGQKEFAMITLGKTGTGTAGNWLHVMEITKDGLEVHEPKSQGMYGQLGQKVTYQYDEKTLTLVVETADGESVVDTLEDVQALVSGEAKLEWLGYGPVESFSVMGDYLFYEAGSCIQITNKGDPEFDGVDLSCVLEYHEDGSFEIGKIQLEPAWTKPIEKIDVSAGAAGEEVIFRGQVWLNHDNEPDWIVTTVTYQDENRGEYWSKRMKQGDFCIVRVYDGARQKAAWEEGRAVQGYFDKDSVIWERTLAEVHAGNGLVYLCEKDGKNYLLTVDDSMGQGIMTPSYKVFTLDENGKEYVIDSAQTEINLNNTKPVFSVDELAEFTEKLDRWLPNGTLIAHTDVERGSKIRKGVLGELVPLGYTAETFNAWEIWENLADAINQLISEIQVDPDSQLEVPVEYVPCTGMDNLRDSLTSLRKRYVSFLEWRGE